MSHTGLLDAVPRRKYVQELRRGSVSVGSVCRFGSFLSGAQARCRSHRLFGLGDSIAVSPTLSKFHEEVLRAESGTVYRGGGTSVRAVGLLESRLHGV